MVLRASLISGLTKAWLGTQNNGTKEVSFSGHTHTASDISGLSNIATGSFIGGGSIPVRPHTINTQFTPNIAIWFSPDSLYCASRDGDYYVRINRYPSTGYALMSTGTTSGMFGNKYVDFAVDDNGTTYAYIIFG